MNTVLIMKNQFDIQYQSLLQNILENGIEETNERTGHVCKSLPGQTMQFDLADGFPLLSLRRIPLKVFMAEQIWFLMGKQDLKWLQQYTKIWDDFAGNRNRCRILSCVARTADIG